MASIGEPPLQSGARMLRKSCTAAAASQRRERLVSYFEQRCHAGDARAEAITFVRESGAQCDVPAQFVVETQGKRRAADEIVVRQRVRHAPDIAVRRDAER